MCEITSGYTYSDCPTSGGYEYAILYAIKDRDTYTLAAGNGTVDTLTMLSGKFGYKVQLDMEQIAGTDNGTHDRAVGSLFYDETAMLYTSDDSVEFSTFLSSIEGMRLGVILIASDQRNGVNRHLGLINGLSGAGETVFGQTLAEGKPTTINLVGKEVLRAPSIDTATAIAILEP